LKLPATNCKELIEEGIEKVVSEPSGKDRLTLPSLDFTAITYVPSSGLLGGTTASNETVRESPGFGGDELIVEGGSSWANANVMSNSLLITVPGGGCDCCEESAAGLAPVTVAGTLPASAPEIRPGAAIPVAIAWAKSVALNQSAATAPKKI
jgi:hypothetical protein